MYKTSIVLGILTGIVTFIVYHMGKNVARYEMLLSKKEVDAFFEDILHIQKKARIVEDEKGRLIPLKDSEGNIIYEN